MSRVYASHYHAGSHNKAKDRRGSHNFQRGKYRRQWAITEANKQRHRDKAEALLQRKLLKYG